MSFYHILKLFNGSKLVQNASQLSLHIKNDANTENVGKII